MSPVVSIFVIFNLPFLFFPSKRSKIGEENRGFLLLPSFKGVLLAMHLSRFVRETERRGRVSSGHSPVGGKQFERSQLTFSWLLGKYTPRAVVVSVCIRVTGARPRATCVSAAIRPAEFRF